MKLKQLPKSVPPDRNKDKWGIVKLLGQFLGRHCEKIFAGVIVIAALWIALTGLNYHPLPWQPNTLEELIDSTEETIRNNEYTVADEQIIVFDYDTYAEQIKERIPSEPYHSEAAWKPVLHSGLSTRGGFEILTAELRGEAARRTNSLKGETQDRWQRPPLQATTGESQYGNNDTSIWVNLYGTIPIQNQWDIYKEAFKDTVVISRPQYVYYELERAEIKPKMELVWQPVIVYPEYSAEGDQTSPNIDLDFSWDRDRLIPMRQSSSRRPEQQGTAQERFGGTSIQEGNHDHSNLLLFSDFNVEPASTYAYRIRLYLANPNYNLQDSSVEEGVDTRNEFVPSDWSALERVYVPDRTTVRLQSVTPPDGAEFPRQSIPWGQIKGKIFLDHFDVELGQLLPEVEKSDVLRGTLGNMSKEEANRYIKGRKPGDSISVNYPDTGLRSGVCIMDFSGGRKLQKKVSKESQGSPELFVACKALLLMPDGTMQVIP